GAGARSGRAAVGQLGAGEGLRRLMGPDSARLSPHPRVPLRRLRCTRGFRRVTPTGVTEASGAVCLELLVTASHTLKPRVESSEPGAAGGGRDEATGKRRGKSAAGGRPQAAAELEALGP